MLREKKPMFKCQLCVDYLEDAKTLKEKCVCVGFKIGHKLHGQADACLRKNVVITCVRPTKKRPKRDVYKK